MQKIISIIIPTYNRALLLRETLDSFINQSYENWETIIIDDGSTDDTETQVKSVNDNRVKYFKRQKPFKKGPAGCRNYGLEKAAGDYILFFDDDDIAHPNLLKEVALAFLSQNLDFVRYERRVFYGGFHYNFDNTKKAKTFTISPDDLDKMVINKLPFNTCAVVWKRESIGEERFNETLFYSDEWEFFQRLLSNGLQGVNLEKTLLYARKHPESSTGYFQKQNPRYYGSTRKAMILVIDNLNDKNLLNKTLEKFFIQKAFQLRDETILSSILKKSDLPVLTRLKYKLGFPFYSILRPVFILKGKLLSR